MASQFQFSRLDEDDLQELSALRAKLISAKLDVAFMRLALLLGKAGFDPNQPRVPAGNPDGGQWSPTAIGGARRALEAERARARARGRGTIRTPDRIRVAAGRSARPVAVRVDIGNGKRQFIFATPAQAQRLTFAQTLRNKRVQQVQQIDPNWSPRPRQAQTFQQAMSNLNRDIRDAEARLQQLSQRPGIGHNQGPPLGGRPPGPRGVPPGDARPSFHATTPPPLTPRELLVTHRVIIGMPSL